MVYSYFRYIKSFNSFIKTQILFIITINLLLNGNLKAQQPTLFPDATWLQDVHFPGTVYAGIPGPIMPSVQAHLGGVEYMFHVKSDVEKARPLIDALHAQGKKYWVNLDGTILEGNVDSIINDNQGITDPNFGAQISLEGNIIEIGGSNARSINRPEWRNFLISCIKRAIDAGADGSQHDGAAVSFDSFDDDDVAAFTQYINDNVISTGDWNPSAMNFRDYLLSKGKNDNNVFNNDSDPQNIKDLIQHWYDFKAVNSLKSWEIVKDSCHLYAQSKGKDYTMALNAGSAVGERKGFVYFASDFGIGEFFQWGNLFPYTGTLAAKSKIFEAFGKRFIDWSGPTLEDIPLANPTDSYPLDIQNEANKQLIATLYASGGLPQFFYPSDQTYPVYFLAQVNRDILNSVSSAGEIGVVMSHAQTLVDERSFEGLVSLLQDINRSFKVIFFKSNRLGLADDITQNDLSKFKVIFLPEVFYLTDNQRAQLLTFMNNGGTVVAVRGNVEYSCNYDENGNTQTNSTWASLANDNQSVMKTYGQGRFINIAHNILESSGYPPSIYGLAYINYKSSSNQDEASIANSIRDTINYWMNIALPEKDVVSNNLPQSVNVFSYQDTLSNHYVYQLLSDSVEIPSRKAISVGPFTIEMAVTVSSYTKTFKATFYTVDNPYGINLGNAFSVNQQTGRITINVPKFSRWGFIDLTESQAPSTLNISNLLINNSATPYRLHSNSDIKATWNLDSGTPIEYQMEVWTNLQGVGGPIVNNNISSQQLSVSNNDLQKANKVYSKTFTVLSNTEYMIPAQELHDSTVYFMRLRAVNQTDTSKWLQQFFYRNGKPASPTVPKIFTSNQNLWYFWNGATHLCPTDTSSKLIYSFSKGCDSRGCYGGDFEMDTLLYGAVFYTDSLTGRKDSVPNNLYAIDTVWIARYAFNEGSDITDTINFQNKYENFGIYFRPLATDDVDTSDLGTIFGFCLDRKNDPPNEFNLISPLNNSYTQNQIPFSWKNNSDPDPFNKENYNIRTVELLFDSVSTFDSPGLKTYGKDRTGLDFEKDTITVDLPPNYFQAEGLLNYKKIYWKAKMWDYDRDAAEGGGKGSLSRESSDIFILNIGATPVKPTAPILKGPKNGAISVNVNPILNWYEVTNATNYGIQLAKDSLFNNIIEDDQSLTVPSKSITGLSHNQKYFWRIKTYNGGVESDWSDVWKFKTIVKIPDKLVLEFPTNNSVMSSDSIKFIWHKSSTVVDNYWFEYSTDSLFSNTTIDSMLTDTTKRLTNIANNNKYWWRVRAQNAAGWGEFSDPSTFSVIITGLSDEMTLPDHYELSQNYPNPFNPSTTINFTIPKTSHVELFIYNLLGEKVSEVVNENMNRGNYTRNINLQDYSSGIYIYKLRSEDFMQIKKMILLK